MDQRLVRAQEFAQALAGLHGQGVRRVHITAYSMGGWVAKAALDRMTADGSVLQVEARLQREVPGEGGFPLAELLAAVPAGTPISVEVPHARLQARLSAVELATYNLRAVRALLAREGTHV